MKTDRDILRLGHPGLRQIAKAVDDFQDAKLQALIDDLLTTLRSADGVGIAAPQVDVSLQIMVLASRPNPRYPQAPKMDPIVLINPAIVEQSETLEKGWEGCLSVPEYRGLVPRSQSVTVQYCDRWGNPQQSTFTGFVARIFQHEYDHFLGLVFLDRLESEADRVTMDEFKAMFPDQFPDEKKTAIAAQT